MMWRCKFTIRGWLTILEDALNVKAVGRTSFVVRTSLEIVGQFSSPRVVDHSGIIFAYRIWNINKRFMQWMVRRQKLSSKGFNKSSTLLGCQRPVRIKTNWVTQHHTTSSWCSTFSNSSLLIAYLPMPFVCYHFCSLRICRQDI